MVLSGVVPVATMQNYQREVVSYTKGRGRLSCVLQGYFPCHNAVEVVENIPLRGRTGSGRPDRIGILRPRSRICGAVV